MTGGALLVTGCGTSSPSSGDNPWKAREEFRTNQHQSLVALAFLVIAAPAASSYVLIESFERDGELSRAATGYAVTTAHGFNVYLYSGAIDVTLTWTDPLAHLDAYVRPPLCPISTPGCTVPEVAYPPRVEPCPAQRTWDRYLDTDGRQSFRFEAREEGWHQVQVQAGFAPTATVGTVAYHLAVEAVGVGNHFWLDESPPSRLTIVHHVDLACRALP